MKNNPPETNAEALTLLADAIGRIRAAGFVVTGGVMVSKPATLAPAVYDRFDAPGGRFSSLRYRQCDAKPAITLPEPLPGGEKRISVDSAGIGATVKTPVSDGLVREGSICADCGGITFERRGVCLYCISCGSSVGGCS